ncbi:sensor histidine kinase [Geomonas anaerohicana]|uniref:Oxygen sensor histidine kinase NreB n=1 Tax=Geomonas anaerohicana TaxID=2798583 RepID=A0ABS0YGU6_9BACT|nr:histidine kinase [Geomonas anaerohicana]MBJ6751525.1 PAS domain S-box protein [Geomonas anaerohicana]
MKTDLFASIVGNLSDGIYVIQHGKAVFLNQRFGEIFGHRDHESLIGCDMFAEVYPDWQSVDLFRKVHEQLLSGNYDKISWGQPSAKVDGTPFWIEVEARLIEVQGEPAVFGTFLDRTDCKLIGEAMHASQETLRLLLDAMEDRVYVVTDDYRLVYANRKMKAALRGEMEKEYCYKLCRGLESPCEDCSTDHVFISDRPMQKEYFNQLAQCWYSVIELPVRMPGIDRPTKLAVARDITERREAEEKIRALSHRLINVQEDERKHLSRELHDDLGQRLNAAKIAVDLLAQDLAQAPGDVAARLGQLSQMLKGGVESVRHLSAGLRPASLERLGLVEAVRNDCDQLAARQGLKVEFTHHGMEGVRLSQDAEINLYRVVQEALNNVVKHAGATEVGIQLVASYPIVRMRIRDNGTGFDPGLCKGKRCGGLGLVGMAERVELLHGSFKIHSNPGMGTRLTVEIPIAEEADPEQARR